MTAWDASILTTMFRPGRVKTTAVSLTAILLAVAPTIISAHQDRPPAVVATALGPEHDFDFEIGTWRTSLKRRLRPLTGSSDWVEYQGQSVVRPVWGGRANLLELEVEGSGGKIEGLSLRLYNPDTRQWSLSYSNVRTGTLTPPVTGEFKNGRGVFYGVDEVNGRVVLVRFVISDVSSKSAHFEQAFSDDGGATWEVNWIATDTRVPSTKTMAGALTGRRPFRDDRTRI